MKRTNSFEAVPNVGLTPTAVNNAKLWNETTYRRRKSFFEGKINYYTKDLEEKYKPFIGPVQAQQIVRKSNSAWRSFFRLLEKQREGKLPPHMQGHIHPPGYWKDGRTGEYTKLIIIGRNDRYSLTLNRLRIDRPRDKKRGRGALLVLKTKGKEQLKLELKGKPRWTGKQGALEIVYDYAYGKWYAHQAVRDAQLLEPPKQRYLTSPLVGCGLAASDMGVVNISATTFSDPNIPARLYKGGCLLSEWAYLTKRIAQHQTELKKTNNRSRSKRLSKLYAMRTKRVRHLMNAQIRDEVMYAASLGVKTLRIGNLTGLRENNEKGDDANQKVHNFMQYAYRTQRYRLTAEEYGLTVKAASERNTSKTCSLCGERHRNGRKHRGLYHCTCLNVIMNADANGSENLCGKVSPRPINPLKRIRAIDTVLVRTVSGSPSVWEEVGRSSRAVTRPIGSTTQPQGENRWEPRITLPSGGRLSNQGARLSSLQ